jgi:hypothetical protein
MYFFLILILFYLSVYLIIYIPIFCHIPLFLHPAVLQMPISASVFLIVLSKIQIFVPSRLIIWVLSSSLREIPCLLFLLNPL